MKYFLLLLISFFITLTVFSQASDFIVLKKKNDRTLKSYFPGVPIIFETFDKRFFEGYITAIQNDSVFIKVYDVRTVGTIWGVTKLDTAGSFIAGVHYKEINKVYFDTKRKPFSFITDGTLFMIGGGGYALLNVINGAYLKESISSSKNLGKLGIAAGVFATGFIMHKIRASGRKNYHVEYIHMNDVKKQLRGF
jgi:hypothetical protein